MSYFLTDDELKTKLLDVLQKTEFESVNNWDVIITDANESAYNDIVRILVGLGYTIEQVKAWDAGKTFNIDLALFWCLVKGGCTKDFDDKFINDLDRRKELAETSLTIDGVLAVPVSLERVGVGKLTIGNLNLTRRECLSSDMLRLERDI